LSENKIFSHEAGRQRRGVLELGEKPWQEEPNVRWLCSPHEPSAGRVCCAPSS